MERVVLFVDNDREFLASWVEILNEEGYKALPAESLEEAQRLLEEERIHLAVLDIRMMDDHDLNDVSGLLFAQEEKYRDLPKIVLTSWPEPEYIIESLRWENRAKPPPAVDFVDKRKGPLELLGALERAFAQQIRIDAALDIRWQERIPPSFLSLADWLEPELADSRKVKRAAELEDLVRKLFFGSGQVTLGRIFWHRPGRIGLGALAPDPGGIQRTLFVTLGLKEPIKKELESYDRIVSGLSRSTVRVQTAAMLHYEAIAYSLLDLDLGQALTFEEYYREGRTPQVTKAISNLFDQTLAGWHEARLPLTEGKSFEESYMERLNLPRADLESESFQRRMETLAAEAYTMDRSRLTLDERTLTVHLPSGDRFCYANPLAAALEGHDGEPMIGAASPGPLCGDTLLVDQEGRVWLTDFIAAGPAPALSDYISLEALIRFDLAEPSDLAEAHDFETRLEEPDKLGAELNSESIGEKCRKALKTIQEVRAAAARDVGDLLRPYRKGLLLEALNRLRDYSPGVARLSQQRLRLLHALLAAAMLAQKIKPLADADRPAGPVKVEVNEERYEVIVEGHRKKLRPADFAVFLYLYRNAERVCSLREIVEQGLKEKYLGEGDEGRLRVAINRIRDGLAPYRDLIQTVPNKGYKFSLRGGAG